MRIAILGSGNIGGGLARAWAKKGHSVVFGARDPNKESVKTEAKESGASVATVAASVDNADVVVLAVPHAALDDLLAAVGPLTGRVVIDCVNAIGPGLTLKMGHTTSSSEELQKKIPGAHVVKSFSAQGAENLENPNYGGVKATNFYCGDDVKAKQVVHKLVEDVGFEAMDAGPLKSARYLEPMTILWIGLAGSLGSRDIAFKMLQH